LTVNKEYISMSRFQLEAEGKRLKDRLEDMEDTFRFNLANTAAHISGKSVAEHEREMEALRVEISEIERLLADPGRR
jgi:hypothetical protein